MGKAGRKIAANEKPRLPGRSFRIIEISGREPLRISFYAREAFCVESEGSFTKQDCVAVSPDSPPLWAKEPFWVLRADRD
jgi:hypothetical protein